MKKLTCKDLGGPCDMEITGESFMDMGKNSHAHVMEQIKNGDSAHQIAVQKMIAASPTEQAAMMAQFQIKFNEAPTS